jgi:phage/plasmid-associated DNA primase
VGDLRLDADQVAAFVDECCEDGGESSLNELFGSFREWCERTGRKMTSNRTFSRRLRSLGHKDRHTRNGVAFGLTVLPKPDWSPGKARQLRIVRDGVTERDGAKNASVTRNDASPQGKVAEVTM